MATRYDEIESGLLGHVDVADGLTLPDVADPAMAEEVAEPSALEKLMLLANAAGDISHTLDKDDLLDIGTRVVEDYEADKSDRTDWETIVQEALKAASQEAKGETKTYPWPNASNINYPLLTTAALQFNARAYPAIVNPSGITPLGGHLVVAIEKSEAEKRMKAMGLEMPGNSAERDKLAMQSGTILAVALDARFGIANHIGKQALFGRYAGTTVKGVDGEDYRMLFDEDVKGTLDG